jgi:hypothetical protein
MRPWLAAALATCASAAAAYPAGARVQTLPASVRACAHEKNPTRRLACYDREVARYSAPNERSAPRPPVASPVRSTSHGAPQSPATAKPAALAPAAIDRQPASAARATAHKPPARKEPNRVTARVVALEGEPGARVLRLDNGETWRQVGRASGDLTLRVGNEVTIEKHLGGYWLSSRYVYGMHVTRKRH